MKTFTGILLALLFAALLVGGCTKDKESTASSSSEQSGTPSAVSPTAAPVQPAKSEAVALKTESAKDAKTITTSSGLKYQDTKVGTGPAAKPGDEVIVEYTGRLTDGTQFDSSVGREPFQFTLGAGMVIKGWDEGVAGMKVHGKRKLIIPSDLGYGPDGAGDKIPGNAVLVFDVELLGIAPK